MRLRALREDEPPAVLERRRTEYRTRLFEAEARPAVIGKDL
jgi:hypothetical protein